MTDLEALQSHLRAHPEDQQSWLVYADHLTDQGDARGRASLRVFGTDGVDPGEQSSWGEPVDVSTGAGYSWRGAPIVRVSLPWREDTLERLAWLLAPSGRLAGLDLRYNNLGDEGARSLASSVHLRAFTELNLHGNRIGADGAAALAESGNVGALRALTLHDNPIGPEGARALARSERLDALVRLDLQFTALGDEGARAVASQMGPSLAWLSLIANEIRAEGAIALAASPYLRGVRELYLGYNPIGDEGAIALARSENLRALEVLDLTRDLVGNAGAIALARSENLHALRVLYLSHSYVYDAGLAALAASETLRQCQVHTETPRIKKWREE